MFVEFASQCVRDARPEVRGWTSGEFFSGLLEVVWGLKRCVFHKRDTPPALKALESASRKVRFFASLVSAVSFIVCAVLWLVVIAILWIVSGLVSLCNNFHQPWALQMALDSLSFKRVIQTVIFVVPLCTVCFLRYWAYDDQDRVFVASLRHADGVTSASERERLSKLGDALEILPEESTWVWLKRYVSAAAKSGCLSLGILALTAAPMIGPIVLPASLLLKRSRRVGVLPAFVLFVVSFAPENVVLPSGRVLATWGLSLMLTARATANELLYTMRSRGSKSQRHILNSAHHARITGFGLAAAAVLSIPIVGPFFWFNLVQLAAEMLSSIVASEGEATFDLSPAVAEYKLQQARKKEQEEQRAREREERMQEREAERERRAQEAALRRRCSS